MTSHCRVMTIELNEALTKVSLRSELTRVDLTNPRQILDALKLWLTDESAEMAEAEFAELPRTFLPALVLEFREAEHDGVKFELISQPASLPLEFARNGRVAYYVAHEEDAVRMYVQHVHGHHADRLKAREAAAT